MQETNVTKTATNTNQRLKDTKVSLKLCINYANNKR